MYQLNPHEQKNLVSTPVRIPIIQKLITAYKLWHEFLAAFPKTTKYTLGSKIDQYFAETIEAIFIASYLFKSEKLPYLQKATTKLDLLKFFLQLSWEVKSLDTKKYVRLSEQLSEIGKMIGGWSKQVSNG